MKRLTKEERESIIKDLNEMKSTSINGEPLATLFNASGVCEFKQKPLVSVGEVITSLVDQGISLADLRVANDCLILLKEGLRIKLGEIYQGEINLDELEQRFNLNK